MKTPTVPYSIIASLLSLAATHATIVPYAEFPLGEAGTLGSSNKPQDTSGNNRHYVDDISGGSATTGNASFHPNALGSTAYLDTSNSGNEGWYSGNNPFSGLATDNFAFGVFARAASQSGTTGDIFTLGGNSGAFKLSLESNGWAASCHNVAWIGNGGGSSGSFAANTWVHLAVIRSAGVSTFYINGVAQGGTFSGAPLHGGPHMSVNPGGSNYFDGHIDEARVMTFGAGETTANILTALQQGVTPTSLVNVGVGAHFHTAPLTTDAASYFRLGGAVQDSAVVTQSNGLSVVAGTAPKHVINITQEGEIPTGSYPLIYYTGSIGGLGYTGFQLAQLPGRIAGNLFHNTANSTVDLVITGSQVGDITWTGSGGGTWNVEGNTNWVFTGGAVPTKFYAGDTVRFDDNAATSTITVAQPVTPGLIAIDNTARDYSFSGSGIGGSGSLDKFGTGSLTFTNSNTHTGPIYLDAGTVRVGNGGGTGSLGTGSLTNNTTLIIDRTGTLFMPNAIAGTGTIEKRGAGALTLSGSSSFSGEFTLTAGTVISGNSDSLGSTTGSTTVAAGATLDVYTGGFGDEPIILNGSGMDDLGAIVNSTVAGNLNGVQKVTLASDSTIGGTGRWDVRGGGSYVAGNFKLTKIASNQISLVEAAVSVKDIDVEGGQLTIEYGTSVDNTNPGTITVYGGSLGFGSFNNPITCTKPIVLNGGAISSTWFDNDGSASVASTIELSSASNTFNVWNGATLTFNGVVSGTGSLLKTDTGTVALAVAPAYTGDTTVAAGTLSLGGIGLADSSIVNIGASATLNLNFTGTDTVNSLFIGGVQQAAGVYDSSHVSGRFSGSGTLTVTTGPVSGYLDWETTNGIAGAGSGVDSDNDGITNGIEFVLGGDPSGPGSDSNALLPTSTKDGTHLVFVYRRTDASVADGPYVQYDSDLAGWTTAQDGVGGVVIETANDFYDTGVDRVTVRLPLALAANAKLFARLAVEIP